MADGVRRRMTQLHIVLFLFLFSGYCTGKILKYDLLSDDRNQFTLSTFGFLKKGTLDVEIIGFSFKAASGKVPGSRVFGFTLDKSKTKEVSSYIETMQNHCILKDSPKGKADKSVSMIFFVIDPISNRLIIDRRKDDVEHLLITEQDRESYLAENNLQRRDTAASENRLNLDSLSDTSLLKRHNRETKLTDTTVPSTSRHASPTAVVTSKATSKATSITSKATTKATTVALNHTASGEAAGNNTVTGGALYFPLNKSSTGVYSGHFLVAIRTDEEEGLYNLFFHNCMADEGFIVNLSILITEDNNGNFLSAGQMPEPALFFTFSLIFFLVGCLWLSVLKKAEVFKIHFLMLSVVFVKSLSCAFHGVNSYFIMVTGIHEETWAILYYIVYLFKGALMFTTILLIGAGWAFIKHMLSHKEKKLFLIVIPLQVLDQVAWVILEESEEGQVSYTTWKEIFILFDLLCCGAILFPVVWSIRHLQEGSRTDGKAAMNLNKLKLFRHFYIMIVCFIYFTRIIVYLSKMTLPFKLEWLTQLFNELATLIFFTVTGYKFRPADDNPYLQVPLEEEDDMEMEEVLTQTGLTEGVVKVNQRFEEQGESTEPLIKQRESSHEYD